MLKCRRVTPDNDISFNLHNAKLFVTDYAVCFHGISLFIVLLLNVAARQRWISPSPTGPWHEGRVKRNGSGVNSGGGFHHYVAAKIKGQSCAKVPNHRRLVSMVRRYTRTNDRATYRDIRRLCYNCKGKMSIS